MSDVSPTAANAEKTQHLLPAELLHDLRTPIGHVLGYAELLKEQAEEAGLQDLLPFIEKIHTAGAQLLTLLEQNFKAPQRRASDSPSGSNPPSGSSSSA